MRIKTAFCVLAIILSGCVEDKSSSVNPINMTDMGAGPVATDGMMGGADASCNDMPAPWWCTGPVDGGNTPVDDGGDKPDKPDKPDDDKKFTGWTGAGDKFSFTRYAGDTQTCALHYTMLDPMMVDDCEACEFAYTATLSAVEVTLDEGGCGDAGNREGEVVFFGHGTMAIGEGLHPLYSKKMDAWEPVPMGFSLLKDGAWIFYITLEDEPAEMGKGLYIRGELDTATGVGAYSVRLVGDDGQVSCEVSYPIAAAMANETCDQCTFAWDLPLGELETVVAGGECAAFSGLSGTTELYGHLDPNKLFIYTDGGWVAFGSSAVEGTTWRFGIDL